MPFAVAICLVFSQSDQISVRYYPDTQAIHKTIQTFKEIHRKPYRYGIPLFYKAKSIRHESSDIESCVKYFNAFEKAMFKAYLAGNTRDLKEVRLYYKTLVKNCWEITSPGVCIATHNMVIFKDYIAKLKFSHGKRNLGMNEDEIEMIQAKSNLCSRYGIRKIAEALRGQDRHSPHGKKTVMPNIEQGVDIDQLKLINFIFAHPVLDKSDANSIQFPKNLSRALTNSDIAIKLYMIGFYMRFITLLEPGYATNRKGHNNQQNGMEDARQFIQKIKAACARINNLKEQLEKITGKGIDSLLPAICKRDKIIDIEDIEKLEKGIEIGSFEGIKGLGKNSTEKAGILYYGGGTIEGIERNILIIPGRLKSDSSSADTVDTTHTGGAPWKTIR